MASGSICARNDQRAGPVAHREEDIVGRNVAMAARVASQAAGGEVLVTDEVHDALGDDVAFVDSRTGVIEGDA